MHEESPSNVQALLAAIVEASDDAIVSKTLDGIILSWNRGAERLFGYTADEAIGQSINLIIPTELRHEERSILAQLRRGQRIDHFETVRVAKTGRRIDISLTVSPIRDESGRVIGASKVARDVTERKHVEEALRASEQRFRELANSIDQFVWTCDPHGRATWYNQRWYDFTGISPIDAPSDGWERVHPDHIDRVNATLDQCLATGRPWEDSFPLRGRDGRYRWFLSRAVPIRDQQGRLIRWIGTNTDITRQWQLEEALRTADRRKDEFLATLAHELRNPLAPIRNSLEILKREQVDAAAIRHAHGTIERQLAHMVRLVDDLLDVSRITRDRLELRKTRVTLAAVVEQAVETCKPLAQREQHTLEVSLPDRPVYLDADPVRIAQVIGNLLTNACKYTEPQGRIRLTAELDGNEVVISVEDDGIGLPPEMLESIFEMFSQLGESLERSRGGLGVGLTLARRLVELHGGTLVARSRGIGEGSQFVVKLPVLAGDVDLDAAAAPQVAQPTAPRRRVLVVDDNRDSAETLALLLKIEGHLTRVVYDGPEAVAAAESFSPDLVLLDIGLPGLNGFEVCRRIREQPWGQDLMIVALTGWGQETDRLRSKEAGFDGHMVKPPDHAALLKLLASRPSVPERQNAESPTPG